MAKTIIIAGGGIAGLAAAEAARKEDPQATICLYSAEADLPYYRLRVAEILANPEKEDSLFIHPADWYQEQQIEVHPEVELTHIDPEAKAVSFSDGKTVNYDQLILTTGSRSRQPNLPGAKRPQVFTLWTMADARAMSQRIDTDNIKKIAIVGGGVLGMEAAWQLHLRGLEVAIIERSSHLMTRQLTEEASLLLQRYIESLGIEVYTDADTESIEGAGETGKVTGLTLKDGRKLACDAVLFSIGVLSNVAPAEAAGLAIGRRIKVDTRMQSSVPDIYASGDACEVDDGYWFGLWSISMQQGRVAGRNAAGGNVEFTKTTPPYIVNTMKTRIVSQGEFPDAEEDGVEIKETVDEENYSYRRLYYRNGKLVGFMLIGDAAQDMVQLQKSLEN